MTISLPRKRLVPWALLLSLALATASLAAPRPMRPAFKPGLPPLLERLVRDLHSQVEAGFGPGADTYVSPTAPHRETLQAMVANLADAMGTDREGDALMRMRDDARGLGLQLTSVAASLGPCLQVHERRDPARGWGMLVMRAERRWGDRRVIIEVPHPVSDPHTGELGMRLFEAIEADAVLFAGATRDCSRQPSPDVPRHAVSDMTHVAGSAFQAWHAGLTDCRQPVVVQVHAFDPARHHREDSRFPAEQEVVLSDGAGRRLPHPLLARLQAALEKAGMRSSVVGSGDGPLSVLGATTNMQRHDLAARGLLAPSGTGEFIHVEIAAPLLASARSQAVVDAGVEVFGRRSRED